MEKTIYGAKIYNEGKAEIISIEDIIKYDKQGKNVHDIKYFCPECKKDLRLKYTSKTNKDSSYLSTYKGEQHDCEIEKKFSKSTQIKSYAKSNPNVIENSLLKLLNGREDVTNTSKENELTQDEQKNEESKLNETFVKKTHSPCIRTFKLNRLNYIKLLNLNEEILKFWGELEIINTRQNKNESLSMFCRVPNLNVYFSIYLSKPVLEHSKTEFKSLSKKTIRIAMLSKVSVSEHKEKKTVTLFVTDSRYIVVQI